MANVADGQIRQKKPRPEAGGEKPVGVSVQAPLREEKREAASCPTPIYQITKIQTSLNLIFVMFLLFNN
ncbi:hypothetical protein ACHEXK_14265 [Limnohabitans sp. DCL3]|jgi:hypothetical protein|uniref:hypothetical protein n=1 Tax=Limnohabitans sp. DCL3 TaxID=3374103 RepID=UPI003A85F8F0